MLVSLSERHPEIPVIIVTGSNELARAVECMRKGAFDYLVKPPEKTRLASAVERAVELRELRSENELLTKRIGHDTLDCPEAFARIVTNNAAMKATFQYMEAIAQSLQPVLITGETGVGKELVACVLHELSGKRGELVSVNVAGLDDIAFSDTLFGHKRGAYTGADEMRQGLVKTAAGGTLVLDEIGDLAPASQVKLLRLLQEREYRPLGSDVVQRSDTHVVAITNHDLWAMTEAGTFRRDLFYRLNTHTVHLCPLRERTDDLPLLLDHFLAKAADAMGKKKPTPPRELTDLLAAYHFPGNVRELEAMVFDAVANHRSKILSMEAFQRHIAKSSTNPAVVRHEVRNASHLFAELDQLPTLKMAAENLIEEALRRANGNQSLAARLLGMTQSALNKRLTRSEKYSDE